MQSKAKEMTTYIDEAPAERREALNRLRDLCREILLDFEETMEYGGPSTNGMGKGAIRYSRPERIDFRVVESMLCGTLTSTGSVC